MFDPTAFDNMKVVIEGALYDLDICGEIVITDRNDSFNMAKMSRTFDISFRLPEKKVKATIELQSGLVNLAAELLPSFQSEEQAGCMLSLQFHTAKDELDIDFTALKALLVDIWGPTRTITQRVLYDPLSIDPVKALIIKIEFDRLIHEDQIEDLVEMTEFIITTLKKLNEEIR
ncbi:hypothetical protein [Neobacillus sp. SuZ13]|uniref:hypothetical protein n=1 Tax=Neobacillus sp. SuZ13 TaxID=3047875 RepID=UPI0024BFF9FD|nr:hypothetical protein [Neobacillus sp. SuZ13]WHY65430.1 hypothetical protein QNH17_20380 [Neobacillus sp. SuZ13]